jgi:hypothetical protein
VTLKARQSDDFAGAHAVVKGLSIQRVRKDFNQHPIR